MSFASLPHARGTALCLVALSAFACAKPEATDTNHLTYPPGSGPVGVTQNGNDPNTPTLVEQPNQVVSIAAGPGPCALFSNGQVKCWGRNDYGNLGNGTTTSVGATASQMGSNLVAVNLGQAALQISTNPPFNLGFYTCALLANQQITCWGANSAGQLGVGDLNDRLVPVAKVILPGVHTALSVTTGSNHACALLDNHQVSCWGENRGYGSGDVGDGTSNDIKEKPLSLVDLGTSRTALSVQASNFQTCALMDTHQLNCWGWNSRGVLGYGDTTARSAPGGAVFMGTGRSVRSYSMGYDSICVILDDNTTRCWGNNQYGQLGNVNNPNVVLSPTATAPVTFGASRYAVEISAGQTTCAILDDGSVKCWGLNATGAVGIGSSAPTITTPTTVDLGTGRTAAHLATNIGDGGAVCLILDTGEAKCWSDNNYGELGLGDLTTRGNSQFTAPSTYGATPLW